MSPKTYFALGVVAVIVLIAAAVLVASHQNTASPVNNTAAAGNRTIQVVAAENFWGSLVSQLGGTHVQVLSIVSDPNADPHEYESNTRDAQAIANADYVIVNGAGYDDWAIKLIGAGVKPGCKVLNVANLLGKKAGDNPHFWYSPDYVNQTVKQMEEDLISIDPANATYYEQNYANLESALGQYQGRIAAIRQQFNGTKVASTETIFQYLADAAGLDLISPPAFMQAISEGNDPPAQSVVQFQEQLNAGGVRLLVYNQQTVTPVTDNMKTLAVQDGIPVVGITETMQPPGTTFQDWMNAELVSIQNALNATNASGSP